MPIADPLLVIVIFSFLTLMALAAINDVRSFTIPNRLNLAILALYPVYVIAAPPPVDWQGGLACGAIAFAIGAFMFAMRWIGGGDVKMMAVAAMWAGPEWIYGMVVIVAVIGGIYSILEGIRGGYPGRYWRRIKGIVARAFDHKLLAHIGGGRRMGDGADAVVGDEKPVFVPYGVAIFVGGFFVAVNLLRTSY